MSGDSWVLGPVLVGRDVGTEVAEGLMAQGVVVVSTGVAIAITADPSELPDSVEWVHTPYMGVDSLLGRLPQSVRMVTRTTVGMPQRMGSYVATVVGAERWGLRTYCEQQKRGEWLPQPVSDPIGGTAIVVGTGKVGTEIGHALRPTFSRIIGVSQSGVARVPFDSVVTIDGVAWEEADCVVIALPLTGKTAGLIGDAIFSRLTGAHVVLVGRGATIDADALRAALESGAARYATMDVFATEPVPVDSWLWSHPRVTMTPHISGVTMPSDVVESFCTARQSLASSQIPEGFVDLTRGY